jgi:dipeptidyl aminopeptidase/acylaminoacyl peptidase
MTKLLVVLTMITLVCSMAIWAQDEPTYTDPRGLFSVPIPEDWRDESSESLGHFVSESPAADIYLLALDESDTDAAIAAALEQIEVGVDASAPLQSTAAPLPTGTWTQNIYVTPDGLVIAALAQTKEDVTYVAILSGAQATIQQANSAFLAVLMGWTFAGDDTPPDYADLDSFEETEVQVITGEFELPGTLSMPKGDGPFPALVLVHGSGPNDRDESYGPNKVFRDLAWGLASQGIAVLRYDKRTLIYGAEMAQSTEGLTLNEETIDDALSAVKLLQETERIDPERVFVLGHSLGGNAAPRIASADDSIAGLVIMAGVTEPLADAMLRQSNYLAELDGEVSAAEAAQIREIEQAVEAINNLTPETPGFFLGAPASYWLDMQAHDPVAEAQALSIPILILQGERDYQVTIEENFKRWQEGLSERENVTFKTYPALNHHFMPGEGQPNPQEYSVANHIPQEVIDDIAAWILAQ